MAQDTIFDKILRKEIPSKVVYEDDDILAFDDVNPTAPVHVLVIPKQKLTNFSDLATADELVVGRYMQKVALVAQKLGLTENGYRVVFNNGSDGQQSVDYLHAHILGGRSLTWPPG